MKILLISKDRQILSILNGNDVLGGNQLHIYDQNLDPLDVMSWVCTERPAILILDDDLFKPNSAHILRSIKKIHKNIAIIFVTSDPSIELGREISPIGIKFYALKPLAELEIKEVIKSITKLLIKEAS